MLKAEKRIVDLYNKIKKLGGGGIQSVTGGLVNNADPLNPVVTDAPSDNTQYARKDGSWVAVEAGGAGKQLKALIGVSSSGGNINSYTPLVNTIGLITPTFTRLGQGIYSVSFANTASVFTGTFFSLPGTNLNFNDPRYISITKIGTTFYIYCRNTIDGSNTDLTPNDKFSFFIESL